MERVRCATESINPAKKGVKVSRQRREIFAQLSKPFPSLFDREKLPGD